MGLPLDYLGSLFSTQNIEPVTKFEREESDKDGKERVHRATQVEKELDKECEGLHTQSFPVFFLVVIFFFLKIIKLEKLRKKELFLTAMTVETAGVVNRKSISPTQLPSFSRYVSDSSGTCAKQLPFSI